MKAQPSQWIPSGVTCREVADRTSDFLDERLPILTNVRVSLHLASCADCRAYTEQLTLVQEAVALLPKQAPSPANRLRLRQQIATQQWH